MKVLVTGAARSGKTRFALARAEALALQRTYLATAQARDPEMAERIQCHQAERGPSWAALEEPLSIAPLLARPGVVLLDCLTLWISNLLEARGDQADLTPDFAALARAVAAAPNPLVIVTNEVGWGIVPASALARRFRDWSGLLSQDLAREVDEVYLVCAGLPLRLK